MDRTVYFAFLKRPKSLNRFFPFGIGAGAGAGEDEGGGAGAGAGDGARAGGGNIASGIFSFCLRLFGSIGGGVILFLRIPFGVLSDLMGAMGEKAATGTVAATVVCRANNLPRFSEALIS